jgi:hypothetical protein
MSGLVSPVFAAKVLSSHKKSFSSTWLVMV